VIGLRADGEALNQPPIGSVNRTLSLVFVATIANLVCGQLFNLLLFALLVPIQVGLINWGTAAVGIVFYVADLGVDTSMVVAVKRDPVALSTMTILVGIIRLAVALVITCFWLAASQLQIFGPAELSVLLLLGLASVVRSFQTPFTAYLQARDHQAEVALIQVVPVAIRLVGLVGLWFVSDLGVTSALVVWLIGEVVGLLMMTIAARLDSDPGLVGDVRVLFRRILQSAPLITLSQVLLIGQSRIDWLIVAALTSYASLANYAIANKSVELLTLAGSVFGRTALPWLVEGWTARDLPRNVRLLSAGLIAGGLTLAIWGMFAIRLLFGHKYDGAAPVIPVLAALTPSLGIYQVAQFAGFARGVARYAVLSGGVGLGAQVIVDLLAIPRYGIIGAAYGMCAYAALALPIQLALGRHSVIPSRPAVELLAAAAVLPVILIVGSTLGMRAL
jgi:O-antigen/teichoic acid export membrane protein